MAVIALLIGLMLPGLRGVRENARRVVCSSNIRQIGLGMALYADASRDYLPYSVFIDPQQYSQGEIQRAPQDMTVLRLKRSEFRVTGSAWDGIGRLYGEEFLNTSGIFYCPSHTGSHKFEAHAIDWKLPISGRIYGNYHYRGQGPNGDRRLTFIEPSRAALAADGLQTLDDFNHQKGLNVLRADLSLFWFPDSEGEIAGFLSLSSADTYQNRSFDSVWNEIDHPDEFTLPAR